MGVLAHRVGLAGVLAKAVQSDSESSGVGVADQAVDAVLHDLQGSPGVRAGDYWLVRVEGLEGHIAVGILEKRYVEHSGAARDQIDLLLLADPARDKLHA